MSGTVTNTSKTNFQGKSANWLNEDAKTSADRTVYMDSNIALTDGDAPAGSGDVETIPNLFKAIKGIDARIKEHTHDNYLLKTEATFDKTGTIDEATTTIGGAINDLNDAIGTLTTAVDTLENNIGEVTTISVTGYGSENKNVVGAINQLNTNIDAIKDKDISSVEAYMYATADNTTHVLYPGTNGNPGSAHADGPATGKNLRLKANDIEFEIPAPSLTGYKVESATTTSPNAIDAVTGEYVTIAKDYYWIPIETASAAMSNEVPVGSCGKVIDISETGGVISSHCRLIDIIAIDTTATKSFTPDGKESANTTIVYNLGAIIEAIQELNRRTMFMDTNMSFAGAIHYGDVIADINGASHETLADGLPGASNANLHKPVQNP